MTLNKDLASKLHTLLTELASSGKEEMLPGGDDKGKASASAVKSAAKDKNTTDNINCVMEKLFHLLVAHSMDNNKKIAEQSLRIDKMEKKHEAQVKSLKQKSRIQEDLIDEIRQRGLKGNVILSSPNLGRGKRSLIKAPDQLDTDVTTHALNLIQQKYNVLIPAEDVQACHHLKSSHSNDKTAILIRIWNRRANSAWTALKKNILTGQGNPSLNLYVNFQLTKRRNTLAYNLRQLKKEGKIVKFYTDENGHLAFKKSDTSQKKKITYELSETDSTYVTMTPEDLLECIQ